MHKTPPKHLELCALLGTTFGINRTSTNKQKSQWGAYSLIVPIDLQKNTFLRISLQSKILVTDIDATVRASINEPPYVSLDKTPELKPKKTSSSLATPNVATSTTPAPPVDRSVKPLSLTSSSGVETEIRKRKTEQQVQ